MSARTKAAIKRFSILPGMLVLAGVPLLADSAITAPAIGTISSSSPITIDGHDLSPAAAPSWPLASNDEISVSAQAMVRTSGGDMLTFDRLTKFRISSAGKNRPYIYVRQGGLVFHAVGGPVYVCIGNRLYASARDAEGILRLEGNGAVTHQLIRGAFLEEGARACAPAFAPSFLSSLPKAAGGTVGAQTSSTLGTVGVIAGAAATAAAASTAAAFATSSPSTVPCSTPNGCNFNPVSISPSQ
jgi:hypothetical protein